MNHIFVHSHACKHGLSEESILCAWENFIRKQHRSVPKHHEIICIGYDQFGRLLEMVAVVQDEEILIIHAMTPPTRKFLRELWFGRFPQ